ncbi:putative FMN-dependent alpha-hydroxy acid dehydrogenase [Gordonia alkanivorans NBRC 16433]|uniref:Putative FMN-dependent alpha-hydroxy acid dehydrogenase n=1 Tax=Gordonia alkanivorans NBRC 16433 TaxID=1027371 RepID=F9VRE9_9ACTN|nr:putative FMN-dependent alpha-hydroxy acid dehydrogenase [Gordonia alkanivorans NBRC 16433]
MSLQLAPAVRAGAYACVVRVRSPLWAGGLRVRAGECAPFSVSSRDLGRAACRGLLNEGLHASCAYAPKMAVLGL